MDGLKARTMIAGRERRSVIEATDIDVVAVTRQSKHNARECWAAIFVDNRCLVDRLRRRFAGPCSIFHKFYHEKK